MDSLPPILHSQRFRSVLFSCVLLLITGCTLGSVNSPDELGTSSARSIIPQMPQLSWTPSSWAPYTSSKQAGINSLRWKADHPGDVEEWQEASLKTWRASPEIDPPTYDTESNHSPPNGTYTAGVVWLTRKSKLRDTLASMESLARYMPMEQDYSFIFMHAGELAGAQVQQMTRDRWAERARDVEIAGEDALAKKMRAMGTGIEFLEINMEAPEGVARKGRAGMGEVVFANVWPGYHSMCRFFAVNIFWNHRIRQLDYYMRMDTDSYILTPMHQDPFRRIQSSGASYAFRQGGGDGEFVTHGMADFIDDWIKSNSDTPGIGIAKVQERVEKSRIVESSRNERKGGFGAYYNNWEIAHVASFRKAGVREWLESLVKNDEGFYKWRWGDAPLRYATIQMFFDPHQYEHYCDFTYYHQFMMKEGKMISEDPPTWKC